MRRFFERARIIMTVLAVIGCIIFAIYSLSTGISNIIYNQASVNWPTSKGEIYEIEKRRSPRNHYYYQEFVKYKYIVNDISYISDNITFGDPLGKTQKTIEIYPVGKIVAVKFNPENPHISCLEPGAPTNVKNYSAVAFGVSSFIMSFYVMTGNYLARIIENYRILKMLKVKFGFWDLLRR